MLDKCHNIRQKKLFLLFLSYYLMFSIETNYQSLDYLLTEHLQYTWYRH